jgi:hypothetical protein
MKRILTAAALTAALALPASAFAGVVVGVNLGPPVVYAPPPVVVAPAPVYAPPPPVVVAPVYGYGYGPGYWYHGRYYRGRGCYRCR